MTTRQLRLLRAASASAVATTLAAVSHTIAGGAAPHPLLLVAVASLLVPLAALLIGARASRLRVALTVVMSQTAFHVVFQLLGAPTGSATGAPLVAGHQHHLDLGSLQPMTSASSAMPDAVMVLGHLAAAVLTTAALWHGESMVRAVAGWVQARLRRTTVVFHPDHERPARPVFSTPLLVDVALSATVSRRGPPAFA